MRISLVMLSYLMGGHLCAFPLDHMMGKIDPGNRASPFEMNANNSLFADVDPFGVALTQNENPGPNNFHVPTRIQHTGTCALNACGQKRKIL